MQGLFRRETQAGVILRVQAQLPLPITSFYFLLNQLVESYGWSPMQRVSMQTMNPEVQVLALTLRNCVCSGKLLDLSCTTFTSKTRRKILVPASNGCVDVNGLIFAKSM